jgi:hypothetical protein
VDFTPLVDLVAIGEDDVLILELDPACELTDGNGVENLVGSDLASAGNGHGAQGFNDHNQYAALGGGSGSGIQCVTAIRLPSMLRQVLSALSQ